MAWTLWPSGQSVGLLSRWGLPAWVRIPQVSIFFFRCSQSCAWADKKVDSGNWKPRCSRVRALKCFLSHARFQAELCFADGKDSLILRNETNFVSLFPTQLPIVINLQTTMSVQRVFFHQGLFFLSFLSLLSRKAIALIVFNDTRFISLSLTKLSIIIINTAVF